MVLDLCQFFFSLVYRGLKESHRENEVSLMVSQVKKIPAPIKSAIKKQYNASYIKDADILIFFEQKKVVEKPEEEKERKDETVEQNPEDGKKENVTEQPQPEDQDKESGRVTEAKGDPLKLSTEEEDLKNDLAKICSRVLYAKKSEDMAMDAVEYKGRKYYFLKVSSKDDQKATKDED